MDEYKHAAGTAHFHSQKDDVKEQGTFPFDTSAASWQNQNGMNAAAATALSYKTPFDSPSPVPPATNGSVSDLQPGANEKNGTVNGIGIGNGDMAGLTMTAEPSVADEIAAAMARLRAASSSSSSKPKHARSQSLVDIGVTSQPDQNATISTARHEKKKKPSLQRSKSTAVDRRTTGKSRESSTVASSSSSTSTSSSSSSSSSSDVDPFSESVIPAIVVDKAFLARRASEPTLGSRRAALQAQQSQVSAAAASAQSQSPAQQRRQSLPHIDVNAPTVKRSASERIPMPRKRDDETAAAMAAKGMLAPGNPLVEPITPRRQCEQCNGTAFAHGLCALHLTSKHASSTPTSQIRSIWNVWRLSVQDRPGDLLRLSWCFWKKGEQYRIEMLEHPAISERCVLVNGSVTFRGAIASGIWKLSMVCGRGRSSAFEAIVQATPKSMHRPSVQDATYGGDYYYELWIDGFPFVEAQNNYMSELGAALQVRRQEEADEEKKRRKKERKMKEGESGSDSDGEGIDVIKLMREELLRDRQYISQHWSRIITQTTTSLNNPKCIAVWNFTIQGKKHRIECHHSQAGGKRVITLDGRTVVKEKPGIIQGYLLRKPSVHVLNIEGKKVEVRIVKIQDLFEYDLHIDGVPFSKCMKPILDYCGGIVDVDDFLQQQAIEQQRRLERERQRRKDPRLVDESP